MFRTSTDRLAPLSESPKPEAAKDKGKAARFRLDIVAAYHYTCALTGYRVTTIGGATIEVFAYDDLDTPLLRVGSSMGTLEETGRFSFELDQVLPSDLFLMVVIGGARPSGAAAGTFLLILLPEALRFLGLPSAVAANLIPRRRRDADGVPTGRMLNK